MSVAFPETALPITVELYLSSTWTDISSDVYERDAIRITRGRSDEGGQVDAGTCSFTLNNRGGKYSLRNASSPYYGLIGRNTPVRVSVDAGDAYLGLPGGTGNYATTPDTAVLDVTGDIDVRVEAGLTNWQSSDILELAGKYETVGDNRSWYFSITSGYLTLAWSPDGTLASRINASSTEPTVLPSSNRLALRATLDVDNGAAGNTVTFYTAESLDGEWTQLGDPVVTSGTTSVFAGNGILEVGTVSLITGTPPEGRIYGFQLRDGIDGTAVADIDFTVQTVGDTSFTGDDGLTWSVVGDASISNRKTRFVGEISSWPVQWDTNGDDVFVPVEASGLLRRLGQGAAPIQSALRRRIPSDTNLLAYWPLEDGDGASRAASGIAGGRSVRTVGFNYASESTLEGSAPLPTLSSTQDSALARFTGSVPASEAQEWMVEFVYKNTNPDPTNWTWMRIRTTGEISDWLLQMSSTGGRILAYDDEGVEVVNDPFVWSSVVPFNDWYRLQFHAIEGGVGFIDYTLKWHQVDTTAITWTGSVSPYALGWVTSVGAPAHGYADELDGMAIGHIAVFDAETTIFEHADNGYAGEWAGGRLKRLALEESIPLWMHGRTSDHEEMGPQLPGKLLDLLQECADADQGILYEEREVVALGYRDRERLYNQSVALTLDYTGDDGLVTPLDPVDDDQHVRNDVTVSRVDGSSGRVRETEGPLSVSAPPDGVGVYSEAVTLNLFDDDQPANAAGWRVHLGTWDGTRYPSVRMLLQKATGLVEDAASVDIGDRIQISNPPAWLPPDAIDLMVQGYSELLHQFRWEMQFNCTPYGPWNVGVVEDATYSRVDTGGSELAVAIDTDDTELSVATVSPAKYLWTTDPEDTPFDIRVGGEVMTVVALGDVLNSNPLLLSGDTTGWTAIGGAVTYSTAAVHSNYGAQASLLLTPDGVTATVSMASTPHTSVGSVLPGASYTVSGWVYSPGGWADMQIVADWYDASDVFFASMVSSANVIPAGEWTFVSLTGVAPSNASRSRVRCQQDGTPAASDISYWWGVRMTPDASVHLVGDEFGRTTASGWGTADSGEAWLTSGGSSTDYSVGSGVGQHSMTSRNVSRITYLDSLSRADVDMYVTVTVPVVPTGDGIWTYFLARANIAASTYYFARLFFSTSGTAQLSLRKRTPSEAILETAADTLAHSAGNSYTIRLQVDGDLIRAKAWMASDSEPVDWQVSATDTDITAAGTVAVRTFTSSTNTNTLPIDITFDDLRVAPQTFTVARSRNGVVKSHAAGADVRLAYPTHVAL